MPDITLRQIRYFAVLSRTLQYRRAAQQLGISQPSLSLQINALETEIGARLVERRRSGLILTPSGRAAAVQADKILEDVEAFKYLAGPAQSDLRGTLRLGSAPTVGPYLLPRVLRRLHAAHPELKLVIRDGAPKELSEDLLAGRHDMILTPLPLPAGDFRIHPLFREPVDLAVANDHPLATRESARKSDLSGESMLGLGAAYAMHAQVRDLCQTSGAVLREEFEGTSLDALRQMVSLGMGCTLLPALYSLSEANKADADVTVIPLKPKLYRQIGLVWRMASGTPPAFAKITELVRTVAREDYAGTVSLIS